MMSTVLSARRLAFAIPRQLAVAHCRRGVATAAKYNFLVVIPDKPDSRARRLEARKDHFEGLQPGIESGEWKMGGALLHDIPKDDDVSSLDFLGSMLMCNATSKEEVLEKLKQDPYSKSDVWDFAKVQIYPFRPGFRGKD